MNNLAVLLYAQGQYAAEPLYRRALEIWEKALGPKHPSMAQGLNNLAVLLDDQGRYRQAEPLYRRALAIRERALGPRHPDVAVSRKRYTQILRKIKRLANHEIREIRAVGK